MAKVPVGSGIGGGTLFRDTKTGKTEEVPFSVEPTIIRGGSSVGSRTKKPKPIEEVEKKPIATEPVKVDVPRFQITRQNRNENLVQFEKRQIGEVRGVPVTAFFERGTDKRVSRTVETQLRNQERQLNIIPEDKSVEGQVQTQINKLRSQGLSEQDIGKQLAAGGLSSGLGTLRFGKAVVTEPVQTVKSLRDLPSNVVTGAKKLPKTLEEEPFFVLGAALGEVALTKGAGVAFKPVKLSTTAAATRLSPNFRKVVKKGDELVIENVPIKGSAKTVDIPLIRKGDKIGIDLSEQAKFSGKVSNPVSAARDFLGTFTKRSRNVGKPLPDEELLSASTKKLLKRFDEGRLTDPNDLIRLDDAIKSETRAKGLLERSFFVDPQGRLRVSRLGFNEQKPATLIDILAGDFTFKKSKPQALLFENTKVAKFPKALKSIEKKLKEGKPLSVADKKKLLKFQLTPTGEFKPIGFLSPEPELTLPPGEVIKRSQLGAVTLIEGNRLPVIVARIKKASPALKSKLNKFKNSKLKQSELDDLESLFKKETGFELSSFVTDTKPFLDVSSSTASVSSRLLRKPSSGVSSFTSSSSDRTVTKKISKPFSGSSTFKKSSPTTSPKIVKAVSPLGSSTPTLSKGSSGFSSPKISPKPFPKKVPSPISFKKLIKRPIVRSSIIKKPLKKVKERVKRIQAYNVLARSKGKFTQLNKKRLTKNQALDLGSYVIDNSVARTAKIVKTKGIVEEPRTSIPRNYFQRTQKKYRMFVKRNKKKIPLSNTIIEKRTFGIDTRGEKKGLSIARVLAGRRKTVIKKTKPKTFKKIKDNSKLSKKLRRIKL